MKKYFVAIAMCLLVLFNSTSLVHADTGSKLTATLKVYEIGYGSVKGYDQGQYYHLTPGNASLEIYSMTTAEKYDFYLYEGRYFPTRVYSLTGIKSCGWYNLPGLTKDSEYYSFQVVVYGIPEHSYYVEALVHDHRAP